MPREARHKFITAQHHCFILLGLVAAVAYDNLAPPSTVLHVDPGLFKVKTKIHDHEVHTIHDFGTRTFHTPVVTAEKLVQFRKGTSFYDQGSGTISGNNPGVTSLLCKHQIGMTLHAKNDDGETGQHDDLTKYVGVTVAEDHDKSQPSGCLIELHNQG